MVKDTKKVLRKGLSPPISLCHPLVIQYPNPTNKGSKMAKTIEIGQQLTTQKSGVSGTVAEVVNNPSGSVRVRLDLPNGKTRWTTVK